MKTVAFISTAGGAGRTTLAAALAVLLARRHREVVALELDTQNLLGAHLGLEEFPRAGLGTAIVERDTAWHAHTWRNADGVLFVPFGELTGSERVQADAKLAAQPRWLADAIAQIALPAGGVVLVDTPRYPSEQAAQAARCADLILCVTPPEPAACATLARQLPALRETGADVAIVVNRLNPVRDMQRDALAMLRAAAGAVPLLAQRVHLDAAMPESFARGSWLFDDAPHSQASHDLHGVAHWLDTWLGGQHARATGRAE